MAPSDKYQTKKHDFGTFAAIHMHEALTPE